MTIETITLSQEDYDAVDIQMYGSVEAADAAREAQKKLWCAGHKKEHGAYYVRDKPSMKHHWRCNSCKKIKQIG
jgi:hypothetical protein